MNFSILDLLKRHAFLLLAVLVFIGVGAHLFTLPFSPIHWIDEVQICEIARGGIGTKATDWTIQMCPVNSDFNNQSWTFYWIGGYFSELGYQLFGHYGARVFSLFFHVLSTFVLWFYIRRKTASPVTAMLVGLIFFANPGLSSSVRGGRFDTLAMGCVFAALAVLRLRQDTKLRRNILFAISGFACVTAVFSWITIVVVLPIVLWEMAEGFIERREGWTDMLRSLMCASVGAIVAVAVFAVPFYKEFSRTLGILSYFGPVILCGDTAGHFNWSDMSWFMTELPYLLPLGIIVTFLRRRLWGLALAVCTYAVVCMFTRCYLFRIVYFLPYLCVALAVFLVTIKSWRMKCMMAAVLSCIAIYSYGYSVVARNLSEWFAKDYRDYEKVKAELVKSVGRNVSLFNDSFQLYYIGRELGWRQFASGVSNSDIDDKILQDVDLCIRDDSRPHEHSTLPERLERNGYVLDKIICRPDDPPKGSMAALLKRHRRLFPLGPYYIYRKAKR